MEETDVSLLQGGKGDLRPPFHLHGVKRKQEQRRKKRLKECRKQSNRQTEVWTDGIQEPGTLSRPDGGAGDREHRAGRGTDTPAAEMGRTEAPAGRGAPDGWGWMETSAGAAVSTGMEGGED